MSYIQVTSEAHVAVLTIDRPKALNALNSDVLTELDAAIDALDIQSWEVTSLPEGAEKTGSANVSYSGTDATITTYDDPSVVTVTAMGQDITLAVPDSAQTYLPFLSYLG